MVAGAVLALVLTLPLVGALTLAVTLAPALALVLPLPPPAALARALAPVAALALATPNRLYVAVSGYPIAVLNPTPLPVAGALVAAAVPPRATHCTLCGKSRKNAASPKIPPEEILLTRWGLRAGGWGVGVWGVCGV